MGQRAKCHAHQATPLKSFSYVSSLGLEQCVRAGMFVDMTSHTETEKRGTFASSCDLTLSSDAMKNGSVASPGYPNPYPPRSHCRYDFQGRGKERVQIVFSDFNLYYSGDNGKECDNIDSLVAYVHIDGRMEKIDSFCGTTVPKPLMSNGPRLMLEFRGIYSSRYSKGFKATYSFTENFGVTSGQQLPEYPCAFVFKSNDTRNGTFSSPNYPGFYPRDTECHYFFHGKKDEKVHLAFHLLRRGRGAAVSTSIYTGHQRLLYEPADVMEEVYLSIVAPWLLWC
uniref:CUB domain-containing protein n=1 Tax=Timema douglasi TaxID=61478 RepID=A0A7R8VHZ4_TIMDO|nr:unnamed protein product [Timema douglasi]